MSVAGLGKVRMLKFLLDKTPLGRPGAEGVDATNENGASALYYACWRDHGACAR